MFLEIKIEFEIRNSNFLNYNLKTRLKADKKTKMLKELLLYFTFFLTNVLAIDIYEHLWFNIQRN